MLVPDKKLLFVHIPKTGGTTIGNIIHPDQKPSVLNHNTIGKKYSDIVRGKKFHFAEHESFDFYKQHIVDSGMSLSSFFVFSFVRNPYSRMFSTWKFLREQIEANNPIFMNKETFYAKRPFNDWVKIISQNPFIFCQEQVWFIKKHECNFLGRYEQFEIDLHKLLDILQIECSEIPRFNQTSYNDEYKNYYDQNTRDIVYRIFKRDFLEFQYKR